MGMAITRANRQLKTTGRRAPPSPAKRKSEEHLHGECSNESHINPGTHIPSRRFSFPIRQETITDPIRQEEEDLLAGRDRGLGVLHPEGAGADRGGFRSRERSDAFASWPW